MQNLNSVTLALISNYPKWYRGKIQSIKHTQKVRGDLALEMINVSVKKGIEVIIADGPSSKSFKKELKKIPGIIIANRRSFKRSPAKRVGFKIASRLKDVKAIISAEAEKVSLISDCLEQVVEPILKNEADIVIPKREEGLFSKTYPAYMVESEQEGNKLYNEYLKTEGFMERSQEDFDFFFGARIIKNDPKVLRLFTKRFRIKVGNLDVAKEFLDPEELSNATYFPLVLALKKNLKVKSVTVPFSYPKLQKENEEVLAKAYFIEKRRSQRLSLLLELIHFLQYLKKY